MTKTETYLTYDARTGYSINWTGFYNPQTKRFDRTITKPITVEQAGIEELAGTPLKSWGGK